MKKTILPVYYEYDGFDGIYNLKSKCNYYDEDGNLKTQYNNTFKKSGYSNVKFLVDNKGFAHSPYENYYPVLSFYDTNEEYISNKFYFINDCLNLIKKK